MAAGRAQVAVEGADVKLRIGAELRQMESCAGVNGGSAPPVQMDHRSRGCRSKMAASGMMDANVNTCCTPKPLSRDKNQSVDRFVATRMGASSAIRLSSHTGLCSQGASRDLRQI